MAKKIIAIAVTIIMALSLFTFAGCTDYGYVFYFSVDGGNGRIVFPEPEWEQDGKTFVSIMGGKEASEKYQYKLEFVAAPDDGYQVKEWTYNDEVIKDNSNSFTAVVSRHT